MLQLELNTYDNGEDDEHNRSFTGWKTRINFWSGVKNLCIFICAVTELGREKRFAFNYATGEESVLKL